jgi:hypothetical protein
MDIDEIISLERKVVNIWGHHHVAAQNVVCWPNRPTGREMQGLLAAQVFTKLGAHGYRNTNGHYVAAPRSAKIDHSEIEGPV